MIITLDSKRRLTLLLSRPGQRFEARFDAEEDALVFRRIPVKADWLEVLAECPVPMDDLPPRGRIAVSGNAAQESGRVRKND